MARSLRLHILSDLHLGVQGMPAPDVDADVTILAGDIARPRPAMEWAATLGRPVLYVPGNHEFYGGDIPAVRTRLAEEAAAHGVQLLDQSSITIQGVRFLGTTLWTDFELYGTDVKPEAMDKVGKLMRDFSAIGNGDGTTYRPADSITLFRQQSAWLDAQLNEPREGPTVVITHHAPHISSVHPRFAGSPVSAAFVSNCDKLLGRSALWVHGHTHDSFDYVVNGTRVLCNPRGYHRKGVNENPAFDPCLCIDIDPQATGAGQQAAARS